MENVWIWRMYVYSDTYPLSAYEKWIGADNASVDVYKRQDIYSESLYAKYSESLSLYRRDWRLVLHHMPSEQRRQSRWAR